MPPFVLFILSCTGMYVSALALAAYFKIGSVGGLLFGLLTLYVTCICWQNIWNKGEKEHNDGI